MKTSTQNDMTTGNNDLSEMSIEEILQYFDPYITAQVKALMRQNLHIAHAAVFDLEIDELRQRVRIKFWRMLCDRHVTYTKAYIKRIVYSEFIDMLRSKKPQRALPLPVDEEGELYQGSMLVMSSAGMADPANEIEEQWAAASRMDEVAYIALHLPPRQRRVMICSLRDQVDDPQQFECALKACQLNDECCVDINALQWPTQKAEKQLLQSSLSAARQNVARRMAGPGLTKYASGCASRETRKVSQYRI